MQRVKSLGNAVDCRRGRGRGYWSAGREWSQGREAAEVETTSLGPSRSKGSNPAPPLFPFKIFRHCTWQRVLLGFYCYMTDEKRSSVRTQVLAKSTKFFSKRFFFISNDFWKSIKFIEFGINVLLFYLHGIM